MSIYAVGITGGSAAPYALRLLELLLRSKHEVKAVVTPAGEKLLELECGVVLEGSLFDKQDTLRTALGLGRGEVDLELFDDGDLAAPIASGSFPTAGMVIVPCSMGSMGRIANGISSNLVTRAADVMLKEGRPLILVPRETPLSEVHLRNMLAARRAGAVILPAMPAFYHQPKTIADMVDMIVSRILDHLGIENTIFKRWKGEGIDRLISMDESVDE